MRMSDRNRPASDRNLILLKEGYELRAWCKSLKTSPEQLMAAVAKVGHSVEKVTAYLKAMESS